MSATHILTIAGGIRCGRKQIRGYITSEEYAKLASQGKLRDRTKTRVKHNCGKRPCSCPRRTEKVGTNMCMDCIGG